MEQHNGLASVKDALMKRNLGEAIAAMETFLSVHPHQINSDRLHAINTDYEMMASYWRRGYKDPQQDYLYNNLLRRMYVLYANIHTNYNVRHSTYLSSLFLKAHGKPKDWSPMAIKEDLENFVSEVAMIGLEELDIDHKKSQDVYQRHYDMMTELCAYLITRDLWSDGFASAMEDILLSPTVDSNDQQLLVSCITLTAITVFDMAKFRLLVNIYQKTSDDDLRQRALVGWVFALNQQMGEAIYPEEIKLVEALIEDESCQEELLDMQKQIIYCLNAEKDYQLIQKEIMPDILREHGFRITPNGLEQIEEDPLHDILHSDEEEKRADALEAHFQRMVDMETQGSDIYFSGFAYMKGYPFFQEISNWFVPFYTDHPGMSEANTYFKHTKFMQSILGNGTFCNSDKYSFVLSFMMTVKKMPESVREIIVNNGILENKSVDVEKTAFIRRMYLQDWYRFSRLFKERQCFSNPYDLERKPYLFFASPMFRSTHLELKFNELAVFLLKKKRYADAKLLLGNYGEHRKDYHYYMMAGYLGIDSVNNYTKALELEPDNERAMTGLARALFAENRYEESLSIYRQLNDMKPDSKSYLMGLSVCLTNLQQYNEAEQYLYRLNYEMPDDDTVNRVLAWTLACDGKYEQADKLYQQLLSLETVFPDDLRHYGFCLWFSGKIDDAIDCFHRYLKESGENKMKMIESELEVIREKGLNESEIQMMLYVL